MAKHKSQGIKSLWVNTLVYINRLLEASALGVATSSQGGYYNPRAIANGGTYANGPAKFDITNDLLSIVADARKRNVPPFQSPYGPVYHMMVDPMFLKDLRANSDFRKLLRRMVVTLCGKLGELLESLRPGQLATA